MRAGIQVWGEPDLLTRLVRAETGHCVVYVTSLGIVRDTKASCHAQPKLGSALLSSRAKRYTVLWVWFE